MTKLTHHDLGTFYERHDNGTNFCTWTVTTWDCPSCNSALAATYIERMGQSCSDVDPIPCPVCGDSSVLLYGATWPAVKVLVKGAERLTEAEANKARGFA